MFKFENLYEFFRLTASLFQKNLSFFSITVSVNYFLSAKHFLNIFVSRTNLDSVNIIDPRDENVEQVFFPKTLRFFAKMKRSISIMLSFLSAYGNGNCWSRFPTPQLYCWKSVKKTHCYWNILKNRFDFFWTNGWSFHYEFSIKRIESVT